MDDPTGNKMLLVMDYMEGGPVMTRDALERGCCIPEPLALQYFRDMCKVCVSDFQRLTPIVIAKLMQQCMVAFGQAGHIEFHGLFRHILSQRIWYAADISSSYACSNIAASMHWI